MSGKNCWPGPTGLLSLPHRPPQHPRFFEGEKMIFKPSNMLLASFFASNFLDENKSRQQREFVFGSSISPPEKARIFSYKKMYSNISLLSTWVALAGNRHKTPRDSSSTAKRHLLSYMYFFVMLIQNPSSQTPNKIHMAIIRIQIERRSQRCHQIPITDRNSH